MTLNEIKKAVKNGKKVYWKHFDYQVKVDKNDNWTIVHSGGHIIGLVWEDGTGMNGKEKDFYVSGT